MASTTQREPEKEDALIIQMLRPVDKVALGVSCGMTAGVLVFVATAVLILKGGSTIGPHLDLLNQYFIGYAVSWTGGFVGLAYGFLVGFILGWSTAFLRNLLVVIYVATIKLKANLESTHKLIDHL